MPIYGPPNVYSFGLFASNSIPTGFSELTIVPDGYTWLIRDIAWFQPAPGEETGATAVLETSPGGIPISGFNLPPGTNSNLVIDAGRFIMVSAGQGLYANSVSVADTTIYISGQQLTLP